MLQSDAPARRRPRPTTLVLAGIIVALVVMWVYALVFAPKEYRLAIDDGGWVAQADAVCADYTARIDELPTASDFLDVEPRTEALRQRAAVLDEANALVSDQIAALRALRPPDNERGQELVGRWLADWDLYLADRRQQSEKWRAGIDEPFAVIADDSGAPITETMDSFAENNRMPACVVPGDV